MTTYAEREPEQLDRSPNDSPPPRSSPSPVRRKGMFASLRTRNYRYFVAGASVSLIGVWMQRVAQDWLVLDLSHGSAVALGIAAALQFAPTLVLSLWAGVLADRMDKRKLLIGLQTAMGLCALALGLLVVTGAAQLWHVYALCLALGCFTAVETPVRQSFVVEMVGKDQVTNAVALNSMNFNMARITGPAIAGVLITLIGTGWVFLLNAATFVAVILGLFLMNPAQLHRSPPVPRAKGQLREGLRYVRGRKDLVVVMVLVFFVSTFGLNFSTTLAVVARNVFQRDADGYGLLSTLLAAGTFLGALLAARRSTKGKPRLRVMIGGAIVFGILEIVVGLMPTFTALGLMLIPTGIAVMTFTTTANSTVQLAVRPDMRGRVMGLYMLVFLGGTPLGSPVMGWVAQEYGGQAPLLVGGIVSLLAAIVCGAVLAGRGGIRRPVGRWSRFRAGRRA
ncbi:MFS transporter [Crossiella cryophila]